MRVEKQSGSLLGPPGCSEVPGETNAPGPFPMGCVSSDHLKSPLYFLLAGSPFLRAREQPLNQVCVHVHARPILRFSNHSQKKKKPGGWFGPPSPYFQDHTECTYVRVQTTTDITHAAHHRTLSRPTGQPRYRLPRWTPPPRLRRTPAPPERGCWPLEKLQDRPIVLRPGKTPQRSNTLAVRLVLGLNHRWGHRD